MSMYRITNLAHDDLCIMYLAHDKLMCYNVIVEVGADKNTCSMNKHESRWINGRKSRI